MRVSNTATYGLDPVYAVCTCGFETQPGDHSEMARAFDEHTVAAGVGLVVVPWRDTI